MARQSRLCSISAEDWLDLSLDLGVTTRITGDPYSMAYGSLRLHFAALSSVTWHDAVLGLHMVYGWMPTIPKLDGIMHWDQQRKLCVTGALTNAILGEVPTGKELRELVAFCNNSIIGASKLLHFLNPAVLPIWDSRVAKAFFNRSSISSQQVNNKEKWKTYQTTLQRWLTDPRVVQRCDELRGMAAHLQEVTDLRMVELVLFHKIETKRKATKV